MCTNMQHMQLKYLVAKRSCPRATGSSPLSFPSETQTISWEVQQRRSKDELRHGFARVVVGLNYLGSPGIVADLIKMAKNTIHC